jgi:hypothetical protein
MGVDSNSFTFKEPKMKNRCFVRAVVSVAALALSSSAFATTLWLKCQACTTANAQEHAERSRMAGTVMVYSLINRFHAKFESRWEVVGTGCHINGNEGSGKLGTISSPNSLQSRGCENVLIATPAIPDAEENELMRALQLLSDNSGGTMKVRVDMPGIHHPDDLSIGSAHDFANDAEFRAHTRREVDRILSTAAGAASFHVQHLDFLTFVNFWNAIRGGVQVAVGGDFTIVTVVLTYIDGSKVSIHYNGDGEVTLIETLSAETRDIMTRENIEEFTLRPLPMDNDNSLDEFMENAQRLGIRVRSVGGSRVVRCTTEVDSETGVVETTCISG